jgi:hypothetical protein
MANLWGFENLPRPPRPRSFGEDAASFMAPLLQTVGGTVGGIIDDRRARELALAKLNRLDARDRMLESGRNERAQAMLELRKQGQEQQAAEKAGVVNALPLTGALKGVSRVAHRPEMQDVLSRYRDAEQQAREFGGQVRGPRYGSTAIPAAEWHQQNAGELAAAAKKALEAEQREQIARRAASRAPPTDKFADNYLNEVFHLDRQIDSYGLPRNAIEMVISGAMPEQAKALGDLRLQTLRNLVERRQRLAGEARARGLYVPDVAQTTPAGPTGPTQQPQAPAAQAGPAPLSGPPVREPSAQQLRTLGLPVPAAGPQDLESTLDAAAASLPPGLPEHEAISQLIQQLVDEGMDPEAAVDAVMLWNGG